MKFLSDILAKAGLTVDGVVTLNNTATGQTPNANDNSTKLATTAWVRTFVQPYSLPIATSSVLGGIKVGTGLSIDAGTGVLSAVAGGSASIKSTQTFTATAAQTVFTITGGYTVGLIDVFLNGVYLSPNQTTATNGTTITLGDAAAAGDIIDVIIASPVYQGATTTTDQLPEGSTNLYFTNARARAAISLTVTGTSGASTYDSGTGVLNVPTYTLAGLGGVPTGRTITIDGVSYDLSANRTWNILPTGGATGDILAKTSATNYDVTWIPNYTSQVQHIVKAGVAVTKGQAVYVSSADGTNMIVSKASNASEQTSSKTLGLVAQNLAINGQGFVVTEGLLAGLDTSTATAGDPVWLGTNGNLIFGLLNKPTAPAHLVFIGVVTRVQLNNGEIFVKVQNGFELDELHNLSVASPSDGDMIKYVASTGLWTKIAATTTNIIEGTNLYYTQGRFDTAFTAKSTTNLSEGTNLYYTNARARAAISVTGSGSYDSATGIITVTGGVTSVNTLTGAVTLTTTNIGEGTNLYYTTARANSDFDTRLATKSTTNLAEGTNLYYTTARANSDFDTRLATKSTTNLAEGTNLYYTDTRVGTYLTGNSYATQSYVSTQINNLVSGAPGLLDTLDELAAALGDDPNFATTVSTALGNRLRIDIGTQGLTGTQQGYGRTNLGLGSLSTLSSIGDAYITDLAYSKLTGVPSTFAPSAHTHDDRYYTETEIGNFFSGASAITGYNKTNWDTAYGWGNHASGGYLTGITSSQVTTALGYTPYNSTNPSGYITGITSSNVITALGYTPYNSTNPSGYITGITSGNVTTALGYTPWNYGGVDAGRNIGVSTNLDTDLESGGAYGSYGAGGTSWNAPFSYGAVIAFAFTSGIKAQFGFNIRHNQSDYGDLHYRTKNNLGYSTWRTMWHSGNLTNNNQLTNGAGYITSSALTPYLPLAGGTMTGTISFTNTVGNKIDFYYSGDDRYGIQVQSSELRIHSGAQGAASGGITLGKSTGSVFTEYLRVRNDGIIQAASYLRTAGVTSNTIYWSGNAESADFGNVFGQGTSSRSVAFKGNGSSTSVWWVGSDGNGAQIPFTAIDATSGAFTFWRNSGGTGGGTWTNIMTMNASGLTINSGNFIGNLTGNAATATIFNNGSLYVSVANGNTLNSGFSNPGDGNDIWLNYRGYNDGFSYFRDFRVGDGKGAQVALFTGSNKSLAITGAISASNLSGTNTGDQTNISGTASNITAYTINQSVGTGNSPLFAGLTINTGGTGTWGPFVVTSTSQWGDGATQYVTIGAGGAAGIMINNPHIVWNTSETAAGMKFGRSGGISSGSYYVIGTGASNNFFINKDGAIATPILNINSSGNTTFSGTISASNLSGTNTGDQTNISGSAGSVAWSGVTSKPAAWLTTTNLIDSNEPDTAVPSGFWQSYVGAGNPTGTWFNYINVRHSNPGNGHGYQLGMSYYDNILWFRSYQGALAPTFQSWAYAISSQNIGSQSVSYATTAGSASANLLLTGGTLTGTLNFAQPVGLGFANGQYVKDNGSGGFIIYGAALIQLNSNVQTSNYMLVGGNYSANAYNSIASTRLMFGGGNSDAQENYYIGTNFNDYGGNYTKLELRWHTGIRMGAQPGYGGIRMYNTEDLNTVIFSVGETDNHVRGYYDIIAYASDKRLKHNIQPIENALSKVKLLTGMTYQWNEVGKQYGWEPDMETREAGVFAQDVQAVLPEAVRPAPFDHELGKSKSGKNFLTVQYDKLAPLLIEAIKEQQGQIESQKSEIEELKDLVKQLINR